MRDKSLRMSFTAVTSASNVLQVGINLGSETGAIRLTSTANVWGFGYSDALNLNRFSTTFADAASFTAQANSTASGSDAPLWSSTSYSDYNVRIAVGTTTLFGSRPVSFTTQSNRSAGTSAPAQSDSLWANCGSTIFITPSATWQALTTDSASNTYTTSGLSVGSFFRVGSAGAGSLTANTIYVLGSDSRVLTLEGTSQTVTTAAAINGHLCQNDTAGTVTVTAYNSTTGVFSSTTTLRIDDCVVFTTLGLGTGATYTRYWVNGLVEGGFTLASTIRGTTLTGWTGSVSTTTATVIRYQNCPEYAISTTNGSDTFETRITSATSVAIPHGLKVGDVLIHSSGSLSPVGSGSSNGLYVTELVSTTQFKFSSTVKGTNAVAAATGTGGVVEPVKNIRMLGIQMDKTTRQWMRLALTQMTNADAHRGSAVVLFADVTPGRDGSFVLS